MPSMDELDYGDEIRGVECPTCGGSLVWNKGRAFCDEDGGVEPVPESLTSYGELSREDELWLTLNEQFLEDEL